MLIFELFFFFFQFLRCVCWWHCLILCASQENSLIFFFHLISRNFIKGETERTRFAIDAVLIGILGAVALSFCYIKKGILGAAIHGPIAFFQDSG